VLAFGAAYWLVTTPSLPGWTNFNDKGLWDVLDLVIIPVVLVIGGYFLSKRQKVTELKIARDERESERRIAKDRDEEQALQTYFSEMSKLLLEHKLRESGEESEQGSLARSRTLTTLRRLNPERKAALLLFLYESQLIAGDAPLVSLYNADLSGANMEGAYLSHANLKGANLEGANLEHAFLIEANLRDARLTNARVDFIRYSANLPCQVTQFIHGVQGCKGNPC
jgi:hypothetical protein